MNTQSLYEKAPYWIQNMAVNVMGYTIKKRRYGKDFYTELSRFENGFYNQENELKDFLLAIKNTKAYQNLLTPDVLEMIQKGTCNIYDIISKFPILDKNIVRENLNDFINTDYKGRAISARTSGTTGGGLIFPYPVSLENKQWAVYWKYRRIWGIQLDTWCGWFGGKRMINPLDKKPPYWRINHPGRQIMYSSYHLTKETVHLYYNDIKKRNLLWLHGYPSHIAKLSALIVNNGLTPLEDVRWVTTGAENLLGNQLLLIKKAFPNAMIRQHYGLGEGVAIMNQNYNGDWELANDFSYVEFVPVNKDNSAICHIIGTGFCNKAFPLVRYDTGDIATVERDDNGGIIRIVSIDGRSSNMIKQPSGHEVSEAALSIVLHDFDNIVEAQVHQTAVDTIVLWVVKGKHYCIEDELNLKKALRSAFDEDMNIDIKYVSEVERTSAGKMRLVIRDFEQ